MMKVLIPIGYLLLSGCAMAEGPTSPTPPRMVVDRVSLAVRPENPTTPQAPPLVLTVTTLQASGWGAGDQDVVLQAFGGRIDRTVLHTDGGGVAEVRAWPEGPMQVVARHAGGSGLTIRFDQRGQNVSYAPPP